MTVDPDKPCPHEGFEVVVEIERIARSDDDPTIVGYMANVKVWCGQCEESFAFTGCPAGLSRTRPMVTPDETELRAPIRPRSADPDFGLGLPGYAVTFHDGP